MAFSLPAWPDPLAPVRRRWRQWWLGRLRATPQCTLQQRNLYIVPTRAGLLFGLTLMVLLVASINYQLNLGYALTFLLAGSALVSMHLTHATLRGLQLHLGPLLPAFAGQPVTLDLRVDNPGDTRHGIGLSVQPDTGAPQPVWFDAAAQGQTPVTLAWLAPGRGHWPVPLLRIETRFPFGLFRAWGLWRPEARVWVYPAPERPAPPLPLSQSEPGHGGLPSPSPAAEFDGIRPWRRGDSLHQVVWKKVAHSGELVSREAAGAVRPPHLWLDWQQAGPGTAEPRLARLTAWVLTAEARQQPFSLRLPGQTCPWRESPTHRDTVLQQLALWPAAGAGR